MSENVVDYLLELLEKKGSDIQYGNEDVTQLEHALQCAEQLGEGWRLPTLEELEGIVCEKCGRPMIDQEIFPATEAEPYWTGEQNGFSSKKYFFSVNFFNGWTFGRFPPSKPLAVRLVRDRN